LSKPHHIIRQIAKQNCVKAVAYTGLVEQSNDCIKSHYGSNQ